ncbi:RagB/SusD family nutrient uptake outer membrane protein, partial [Phocaeicola plebeius]
MKTTIHTIFAALLTGATLLSSCDDYLTTLPSDSLVSEGAITTEEDTKTAVNGLYEGLISVGDSYYYGTDFITRPEVGGEDIQTRMVGDRTENFYRFTDRQSNARESLWSVPYVVINRANVLLDAIESGSIPMTEVTKNSKGEALAIRALAHFNLLITYGTPYQKDNGVSLGVPVVTTVLDAASLPERLTVAQGYEAVLTDLTDALDFISEDKTYGHINLWGVKALIARVNLYKGNYEEAYKYAKDVIDHGGYNLVPNAEYISMWGQRENSESIFDLDLSSTMYGGGRELIGSLVAPSSYGTMIATTDFLNLLNEDPDDVRLGLLIKDKDGQKRVVNKYPGLDGN